MMPSTYDCIVVGAGFSGLMAARKLANAGRSVLVLEGRNRVGGRAESYAGGGHAHVDLGCSWVHGYNEGAPTKELLQELGIPAHVPKPAESLMFGPNGPIPSSLSSKLAANLSSANARARSSALSTTSSSTPLASSLLADGSPLFAHLKDEEKPLAVSLARTMQVGLGAELEDVALRWNGYEDNYDGTNAAPEGGYSAVAAAIKAQAEAKGTLFKLEETVTSVSQSPSSNLITVSTSSSAYTALSTIITIPLGVLQSLPETFFQPPLSARKQKAIKDTNVGKLEKLVLTYPKVWWPAGVSSITILPSPDAQANKADSDEATALSLLSSVSLVVFSFSSDSLPNPHPTLLIYIPHPIAEDLSVLPLEAVTSAAHSILSSHILSTPPGQTSSAPVPSHSKMTRWATDPFSLGATSTPSTVSSGEEERSPLNFVELGKPEKAWGGRLGWAGEHSDVDHRGSVVGAVVSGEREGERMAGLLRRLQAAKVDLDLFRYEHR